MLIAGLVYPKAAAALGLGWTLNRYVYLIGYTNPALGEGGKGRYYGIGYMLCQYVLLGMVGYIGYGMVTSA
jgi:glutathione S-transferase